MRPLRRPVLVSAEVECRHIGLPPCACAGPHVCHASWSSNFQVAKSRQHVASLPGHEQCLLLCIHFDLGATVGMGTRGHSTWRAPALCPPPPSCRMLPPPISRPAAPAAPALPPAAAAPQPAASWPAWRPPACHSGHARPRNRHLAGRQSLRKPLGRPLQSRRLLSPRCCHLPLLLQRPPVLVAGPSCRRRKLVEH